MISPCSFGFIARLFLPFPKITGLLVRLDHVALLHRKRITASCERQ
jgi:hypothetical protein